MALPFLFPIIADSLPARVVITGPAKIIDQIWLSELGAVDPMIA
jgi:hypothetical protein